MVWYSTHYHPEGTTEAGVGVYHAHANDPLGHKHIIVVPQTGGVVTVPCTYQSPWSCSIEAVAEVWCGEEEGFRNFCQPHADRMRTYHRNLLQGWGRKLGHQIAVDALINLATAPYPSPIMTLEKTAGEKAEFDRALRREFLKVVQESVTEPPEKPRGWWCLGHREYHPYPKMACWGPE